MTLFMVNCIPYLAEIPEDGNELGIFVGTDVGVVGTELGVTVGTIVGAV